LNTHRRLRIATLFVIVAAYVLSGIDAAFSAHKAAITSHASTIASNTDSSWQRQWALAPGRTPLNRLAMNPHPVIGHALPSVPGINEPVQTYDVFAPPQDFTTSLFRNAANLTPQWSADESYIIFSSNRDATGKIAADGRYHIWVVPANGASDPIQVTTSVAQVGENATVKHGEFFPALDPSNSQLAFTTDVNSPNLQNLYAVPFNSGAYLTSSPAAPFVCDKTLLDPATNYSKSIRPDKLNPGFDDVRRPTWGGAGALAFSGRDSAGANKGHYHIWYMYAGSLGYLPNPAPNNFPAKLTDGVQDQNNPAWSGDGNFIAFDSNSSGFSDTGLPVAPGGSPLVSNGTAGANHAIFLITPGGTLPGGVASTNGQITAGGTDDITPAWSFNNSNPYTNPDNSFQYVSFARAAAPTANHDIYYLAVTEQTSGPGESPASNIAGAQAIGAGQPLYQINAGGPAVTPYVADTFVTGGSQSPPSTATVSTAPLDDAPPQVYQTYHTTTPADTSFTYTLPTFVPGATYTVALHFNEPNTTATVGSRVFNVKVNGAAALTNYDIFARTGAANVARVETISAIADVNGNITVEFDHVAGQEAIVSGVEVLSVNVGFALPDTTTTGVNGSVKNVQAVPTPTGAINVTWDAYPTALSYKIYRGVGLKNTPTVSTADLFATVPATQTNFVDTQTTPGEAYYYIVTAVTTVVFTNSVRPESAANSVIHLITETNANNYDDTYPAWSAFTGTFSMTYQSNRSVTYNDAKAGPVETAISLPAGVTPIGKSYIGILISQVLNLDPPSLVSFNSNEVIHVNAGTGTILPAVGEESGRAERSIQPGRAITLTVRLSNREAGIDNTGGPNGGPNVYLQIKDPDSKYQDSQGLEHKVFAEDPAGLIHTPGFSRSAARILFNGFGGHGFNLDPNKNRDFTPQGVVAGSDDAGGTVQIGFATGGSVNPDPSNPGVPGPDPGTYTVVGQEYECQYLNPQVANPGGNQGDYGIPFYLAGFDDRDPLSGISTGLPRPTANDPKAGISAEWLPLHRATDVNGKDISNDGKGGILYAATWTAPSAVSDFVFDVIAYDKAVYPVSQVLTSTGFKAKNWRIYDNVWGVSSAPYNAAADIMLVSDYTAGQKFAATAFGGQGTLLENVLPTFFGAESYVSDVDTTKLPTHSWYQVYVNNAPHKFIADIFCNPAKEPTGQFVIMHDKSRNTLGANSYIDDVVKDSGSIYNAELFKSQTYAVWRTLCRGAVNDQILSQYLPSSKGQPAVNDGTTKVAASSVPVANRCVVWVAPYNGDLFTGPGTLADATTQAQLTNFVGKGGRLCVSGPDVGSIDPTSSLLSDVLHAQLVSASANVRGMVFGPNHTLTANNINNVNNIPTANAYWLSSNWRADACFDTLGPSVEIQGGPHGTGQVVLGNPDVVTPTAGASSDLNYNDNSGSGLVFYENIDPTSSLIGLRTVYVPSGLESISNDYYKVIDDTLTPYHFHTQVHNNRSIIMHQIVSYLRTGSFSGFIRDTVGSAGNPVANATVYLTSATGGTTAGPRKTYSASTDSSGFYRILGVPAGTYNITAAATGFSSVTASLTQQVEGDVDVPVSIRIAQLRPATVSGKVVNAAGQALSGATVKFSLTADPTVSQSTTTKADGTYSIDLATTVTGAAYTGVASLLGYLDSDPQNVTVTPGQTVNDINFTLNQAPATITGKVTDKSTGAPINKATVTALLLNSTTSVPATTAADGTYTLKLQPGRYTISATAANYNVVTDSVTVSAGQTLTNENFALTFTPAGSFGGLVTTTTGGPLPGVVITATNATSSITVTSGAVTSPVAPNGDGKPLNYFANAQPGTYTVTFDATSLAYGKKTVSNVIVKSGVFTRIPDVSFSSGQLIGLVLASPNSGPIGGVTVTAQSLEGVVIGTATTTSTTTSPASPKGDGKPINYSITLVPGTVCNVIFSRPGFADITVSNVTIPAGPVRVDKAFPAIHSFTAGLQFFSLPYNYNTTWDALFGPLGTTRSHIAIYQQALGQYVLDPTSPATTPVLGYGYWVRLQKATDIVTAGSLPTTATVAVPLAKGWNMIGVPSTSAFLVNRLTFANPVDPANPITWAQATSIAYNLVAPALYSYNQSTGLYVSTDTAGTSQLQPWTGYWIHAYSNCTVLIPTTGP